MAAYTSRAQSTDAAPGGVVDGVRERAPATPVRQPHPDVGFRRLRSRRVASSSVAGGRSPYGPEARRRGGALVAELPLRCRLGFGRRREGYAPDPVGWAIGTAAMPRTDRAAPYRRRQVRGGRPWCGRGRPVEGRGRVRIAPGRCRRRSAGCRTRAASVARRASPSSWCHSRRTRSEGRPRCDGAGLDGGLGWALFAATLATWRLAGEPSL